MFFTQCMWHREFLFKVEIEIPVRSKWKNYYFLSKYKQWEPKFILYGMLFCSVNNYLIQTF